MGEEIKVNKTTLYGIIFVIAIVVLVIVFVGKGNATGNVVSGEVQHVVIGMKNYKYSPDVINVKAGVPVSLSLDDSVYGCFRDLIIPQMGLSEYLASPKDTLVFTPEKKGEYVFACSMYMGQGKIIVE